MKNIDFKIHKNLRNTDFVMHNTFWIGLHPGLSEEHLSYVAEKIKNFFHLSRKL
jgi:CDP-4-dehydro-6-deoxyglucose reductase, E1|tara:strand:- start:366 stop:527 length:162 start_codon:yes stop_codon:yes gene_type:complete